MNRHRHLANKIAKIFYKMNPTPNPAPTSTVISLWNRMKRIKNNLQEKFNLNANKKKKKTHPVCSNINGF